MFFTALLLSYFCLSFTTKKALYVTSDGISNTPLKEIMYKEETFINSVIYIFFFLICTRKEIYIKSTIKCLLLLLLLVCGDIKSFPGPQTLENVLYTKV